MHEEFSAVGITVSHNEHQFIEGDDPMSTLATGLYTSSNSLLLSTWTDFLVDHILKEADHW
jgi:hypothetical protein